ncbi:hypothetical protein [Roseobacter sp. OBYS 0001]|uniref:hypothetical protein n=1 Tax=Roseobacter sp. OBYS 0001 TaxID=882651 RepID=UPI001BC3547C|nr:hypothetical protein [Roseobacter sp. OBYS 0001]GIT86630.1 hypothetical protein ROBYS_16460 [Roseobacter sp. OBYS 0001]
MSVDDVTDAAHGLGVKNGVDSLAIKVPALMNAAQAGLLCDVQGVIHNGAF